MWVKATNEKKLRPYKGAKTAQESSTAVLECWVWQSDISKYIAGMHKMKYFWNPDIQKEEITLELGKYTMASAQNCLISKVEIWSECIFRKEWTDVWWNVL